jgi:hypothetical protein
MVSTMSKNSKPANAELSTDCAVIDAAIDRSLDVRPAWMNTNATGPTHA